MARTVMITDDIDGSAPAEPVLFGWDGITWEIDLSEANRTALHEALQPYLDKAHPSQVAQATPESARRGRRPRGEGAAASGGDKIDYTAPDRFGQVHRGRLNDEEIQLVRENPEQASRNREAQGHPPIDWDDAKEQARYNLNPTAVNDIKAKLRS